MEGEDTDAPWERCVRIFLLRTRGESLEKGQGGTGQRGRIFSPLPSAAS